MALSEGDKVISAIHRKTALVDHIHLIPNFSGEVGSISFPEFKRAFERLASLYGWEDEEKIFVLFTRVSGSAAEVLRIYEKENKTFEQLCEILSSRYAKKDSPAIALQKFLNFKQTPGMSVQEFFDRASHLSLSALVIEGGVDAVVKNTRTQMLKSMLLNNLSPEIKKGVVARDPKTPEDILRLALLEEKSWEAVRLDTGSQAIVNFPSTSTCGYENAHLACAAASNRTGTRVEGKDQAELETLKEQIKLLTTQVAELVNLQAQNSRAERRDICFNCQQPGHYARFCPSKNSRGQWNSSRGGSSYRGSRYGQQQGNYRGNHDQRGDFQRRNDNRAHFQGKNDNGGNSKDDRVYSSKKEDNKSNDSNNSKSQERDGSLNE